MYGLRCADLRALFEAFYQIDTKAAKAGARLQRTPAATATTSANAATMGFIETESMRAWNQALDAR